MARSWADTIRLAGCCERRERERAWLLHNTGEQLRLGGCTRRCADTGVRSSGLSGAELRTNAHTYSSINVNSGFVQSVAQPALLRRRCLSGRQPASQPRQSPLLTFFTSSSLPDCFIKTCLPAVEACLCASLLEEAHGPTGMVRGWRSGAAVGEGVSVDLSVWSQSLRQR